MSEPSQSSTAVADGQGLARTEARRSLLRANTVVAVVVITVLTLALAATWQSDHAERQQRRAAVAETRARQELRHALLAEAKVTRLSQTLGRRETALEIIRRAAAIEPTPELRNEAVAVLALPEYRLEGSVPLTGQETSIVFDHELRFCALGLTNGDVVVRRLIDDTEVRRLTREAGGIPAEQGNSMLLEFARGGGAISVRYVGGAFAVFDLESGKARFRRDADQARHPASRALFSADGRFIVAPVFTPDGFEVMDAATGRTVVHFPQFASRHHAAVRPGATQFAVFSEGAVHLIDWSDGRELATYLFPNGARLLAWSQDGRHLAIAGNSPRVVVWDVPAHRALDLPGHKADVYDVHFDLDGARLATKGFDFVTRIWDLRDARVLEMTQDRGLGRWGPGDSTGWGVPNKGLELRRAPPNPACLSLAGDPEETDGATMDVSADGNWAVSVAGTNALLVWNLNEARAPVRFAVTNVQSVCFHPRDPVLLLVRDHRIEEWRQIVRTNGTGLSTTFEPPVSAGGASGVPGDLVTLSADGRVRARVRADTASVWIDHAGSGGHPLPAGDVLHVSGASHSGSPRGVGTIALSPDGRWLVIGVHGSGPYLIDARTGEPVARLGDVPALVQFSPDGRWLVLIGNRFCQLLRTGDWNIVWSKPMDPASPGYVGVAAFSPDGAKIACALHPWRVSLLNAEDGRELGVLEAPDPFAITLARWSADGRRLVVATRDNHLQVWQPSVLERELAGLGLGWDGPAFQRGLSGTDPGHESITGTVRRWIVPALFAGAAVAAGLALVSLRHHRRLISEFSETEALALRREQELQAEREMSELKGRFVSLVSHEFRTPLGITMSAVELLRNYADRLAPEKRRELLADIYSSTLRMSALMEQILLLGRVEAGKIGFHPAPLALDVLSTKLVDETQSATNRKCRVELRAAGGLGGATGDESLIRHTLSNLLSNAVKYSPENARVEFEIARDGDEAVFSVRDRGIGIPRADHARLFEAFYRAANVGQTPGTGLGLLIAHRCVQLHGGSITFESEEGRGTVFTVRLPLFAAGR